MAYDEIQDCPDCGTLVYDRCDCGWRRDAGWSLGDRMMLAVGIALVGCLVWAIV